MYRLLPSRHRRKRSHGHRRHCNFIGIHEITGNSTLWRHVDFSLRVNLLYPRGFSGPAAGRALAFGFGAPAAEAAAGAQRAAMPGGEGVLAGLADFVAGYYKTTHIGLHLILE
jgi:hypothetical protein